MLLLFFNFVSSITIEKLVAFVAALVVSLSVTYILVSCFAEISNNNNRMIALLLACP